MMGDKVTGIVVVAACLLASAGGTAGADSDDGALRIYLPREITIEGKTAVLGQVAVVCGDESLLAKANAVALGRIAMPGQQIVIDRATLLSRLASSGIPGSQVRLAGADELKVRRRGQVIGPEEFTELAREFLSKALRDRSIAKMELVRRPESLVLGGSWDGVKVVPRLLRSSVPDQARVQISVFSGDKQIGSRELSFRLRYNARRVVTLVEIAAGEVITRQNVKVERVVSSSPEPVNWVPPYGLVAKRRLPPETVVRPNMVGPAMPPVVLKRNQNVVIRIEAGALLVTAMGRTVEDGRAGDYVRVRNVDSGRIILTKVNEDGTVEPVL